MLFRIIRTALCGRLSIRITFEQSDEIPCEVMLEHAEAVEREVYERYESTESPPEVIAFEIVDKYRHVFKAEVRDEENGSSISCECEDCEC